MNIIIWLIVGGLMGWTAGKILNPYPHQRVGLNIMVGIVGALLAGWLVTPLMGGRTISQAHFSPRGLIISFLGAILLLAIVNL
ncbi:MAG: GlsB/YeaQ/YmgE family stress response membrane protein, partial [Steroidobacteraceae bacterium]